jgi:predicted AlkP superfamily phosphohydrolase/phosphomutase
LGALGAPVSIQGMVRLFMKQVHPKFELYVSPVNIDPMSPVNQISIPAGLSTQLAKRHGRFYTAGIPEDTKALSHGALDEDQFLAQSDLAMQERIAQYREAIADFRQGCLFYYFGATDLVQHMFWRDRDSQHPGRLAAQGDRYANVVEDAYHDIDQLVGDAMQAAEPTDTIIILSDHGFNSFRRGFNLNSWLVEEGYIRLGSSESQVLDPLFPNVDWNQTRAYGLGMNGLYLNAVGREKYGIVKQSQWRSLLGEIRDKLLAVRDVGGQVVIRNVDMVEDIYPGADRHIAPDLIIGYEEGYRASWETVLGTMPPDILVDNLERWSGDHCIHPELVPGVLVSNRTVTVDNPDLRDIAPTILNEFGIAQLPHMTGRPLFANNP